MMLETRDKVESAEEAHEDFKTHKIEDKRHETAFREKRDDTMLEQEGSTGNKKQQKGREIVLWTEVEDSDAERTGRGI